MATAQQPTQDSELDLSANASDQAARFDEAQSGNESAAPQPPAPEPQVEGEAKTKVVLPLDMQQQIELNRQRNMMQAAIRGTTWGKDIHPTIQRAIAEYCRLYGLDPQRHIEVLGGKIYPTATLYEERGAPLILAGIITKEEPEHINADARLDELAKAGDEWAKEESMRRKRLRIKYNVPEKATGVVVQRMKVNGLLIGQQTNTVIVGVNWCGGGVRVKKRKDGTTYIDDPVGEAEPSKTAETRAARRAWKQIADAVGSFGGQFEQIETMMVSINTMLTQSNAEEVRIAAANQPKALSATSSAGYAVDLECRVPEREVVSVQSAEDPFE